MFEQLGMDFSSVAKGSRGDLPPPAKVPAATGAAATGAAEPDKGMVLRGAAGEELMRVDAIEAGDGKLLIRGKSFGTMPIEAQLDGPSARAGLKLLGLRKLLYLATLPFRGRAN